MLLAQATQNSSSSPPPFQPVDVRRQKEHSISASKVPNCAKEQKRCRCLFFRSITWHPFKFFVFFPTSSIVVIHVGALFICGLLVSDSKLFSVTNNFLRWRFSSTLLVTFLLTVLFFFPFQRKILFF